MDPTRTVVDDALDQLVHQFSDPLAFLRELVQNAIDAGSTEVAIASTWEAGVTTIHIDDWGEGMTRAIIETRLTRLFSSTKEGDHTKIGRFGIGFVSVFALDPDAVCLDTSREGESWRVLFGRDRSFDLRRLPTAVDGTKIRIIKAMTATGYAELRAAVPITVRRWCRHTRCEIRVDGVPINEPFDLPDAPCRVVARHADLEVVVGHPRDGTPFFGFYNSGLTLFEGHAAYPAERRFESLAWKASSPQLEHTLARDKVIEDRGHARALARMHELAAGPLADRAIEMLAVALA
ncbi:MAG: ATP-binding protein, partial [Deltaproteobacteria bacterium]|nr:ATP-binding protein [Nannocystaceae bacterium]